MGEKDIVSFSSGTFDKGHPQVHAVIPSVNGVALLQLLSAFEKTKAYEPAGGIWRNSAEMV